MTPNQLIEAHALLDLYHNAYNNYLSREMINEIYKTPKESDQYELCIRYLRYRHFISPYDNGDRITMSGISAINSDRIKFEAEELSRQLMITSATIRSANASTLLSLNQRGFNRVAKTLTIFGAVFIGLQFIVLLYQTCLLHHANETSDKQLQSDTLMRKDTQTTRIIIDKKITDGLNSNDTVYVKILSK